MNSVDKKKVCFRFDLKGGLILKKTQYIYTNTHKIQKETTKKT